MSHAASVARPAAVACHERGRSPTGVLRTHEASPLGNSMTPRMMCELTTRSSS
jgi:hypothetical protein